MQGEEDTTVGTLKNHVDLHRSLKKMCPKAAADLLCAVPEAEQKACCVEATELC